MTLSVLRPTATTSNTGTLTGGATAHAVLADDSDASYVTFAAFPSVQSCQVGLTDLTLPAGAVVKSIAVRARSALVVSGTSAFLNHKLIGAGPTVNSAWGHSSTTPGTRSGLATTGWTDPQIDAVELYLLDQFGAALNVYEAYLDVRYVIQPVPTVTAPTGTVTNTNTPTVTWTNVLDPDGASQTAAEVKIYSAAQYGAGGFDPATSTSTWESGVVSGPGLVRPVATPIANATYRAYVRTAQTVNGAALWSAWVFGGFVLSVTPPAVPTLALTAQSTSGRIQAVITTGGGATTTDRVELQRSVNGGTSWLAVRNTETYDGTIAYPAAPVTILDYEAPNGTLTSYRARALHSYTGIYAASAWSTTATATWTATDWWIKHPNVPALNLKLTQAMFSYADINHGARATSFLPLGASLPIVVSDTRGGPTGTVVLTLATLVSQDALDALLDTVATLLLQGPVGDGHPDRYVRFGDHASVRVGDRSWIKATHETLPWTEVALPIGAQT